MSRELCLALMQANSEAEVIGLLRDAGYWEEPRAWRFYGDNELNWSQAGAQQSRADFAFNEKAVNAIDSVLTRMCMEHGIRPDAPEAPQSIREAVARFIEGGDGPLKATSGRIEDWGKDYRKDIARHISVFTTEPLMWSSQGRPSLNIADLGEGHTPAAFPDTFVSLGRRNKVSIQFVQGKFCQGGSGALRYCGEHKLQLIVSRRAPTLLRSPAAPASYPVDAQSDDHWGFTIVRREAATGAQRMSTYTYLAPIGSDERPRRGGVLHFAAATMPLFPDGARAYEREVEFGTLLKLFEYRINAGNIIRRSGLLQRLDLLLPEPALPIRMHECRPRISKGASEQTTTMAGLFNRLRGSDNLEDIEPSTLPITVNGRQLKLRVFAFKPGRAATYRDAEGIVFTVNGQAHAFLKAAFFHRKGVGLQRLASDLLVFVDCSKLSPTELEDAFMSSRDRLVEDNAFAREIEKRLEEALHSHEGLRRLKNARIAQEIQEQLADNRPLEDVLKRVLKHSPALARLFGQGVRLQNPVRPATVAPAKTSFEGRPNPTFFRFQNKEEGALLIREAHLGQRVRLKFETDAENSFFTRPYDPGRHALELQGGGVEGAVTNYTGPLLTDGLGTILFELPSEAAIGDILDYVFTVSDPQTEAVFINRVRLSVKGAQQQKPSTPGERRKPPSKDPGAQDGPSQIDLPRVRWVKEDDPTWKQHFTTREDCLDVIDDGEAGGPGAVSHDYTFYLNDANTALRAELAATKMPIEVIRKQFEISATLIGLAMLYEEHRRPASNDGAKDEEPLRDHVRKVTRAIAPVLLPIVNGLGDLGDLEPEQSDLFGQAA